MMFPTSDLRTLPSPASHKPLRGWPLFGRLLIETVNFNETLNSVFEGFAGFPT